MKLFLLILFYLASVLGAFVFGYLVSESNAQYALTHPDATPAIIASRSLDAEKLWSLVNNWRVTNNFQPYIRSDKLCDYAQQRLMEVKTDWSHGDFLSSPPSFCPPGSSCLWGENLARGFTNESSALSSWLTSPTHRENLEDSFKYSCIVTRDTYAVQEFGNF